jgi:hypothetical protein
VQGDYFDWVNIKQRKILFTDKFWELFEQPHSVVIGLM